MPSSSSNSLLKKIKARKVEVFFTAFFLVCIAVGVVLHVIPYFFVRSLWLDEATLANSVVSRNLLNLAASPLDFSQSAPIGWLYIVKFISCVLGTSEFGLRFFSLLSAFGCIYLIYLLLKDKVKRNYALFITAVFALTDGFIYYGNEFKPYMFDVFACLLTLFLWQKYKDNKISLLKMCIVFAVSIWFSLLGIFFIAACMLIECFLQVRKLIKEKDKKAFSSLGFCAVVLGSFLLNYILWLSSSMSHAGGAGYWSLLKFPLIPRSLDDLKLIGQMARQFFECYSLLFSIGLIVLTLTYIVFCFIKKKDVSHIIVPFFLSLFLLLVASFLGFYPIKNRLVLAYQVVLLVIAGFACSEIVKLIKEKIKIKINIVSIIFHAGLICCLLFVGAGGLKNINKEHVYKSGSQVAESIEYLNNNLTDNDVVYVLIDSIPVYQYETGKFYYKEKSNVPDHAVYVDTNIIYAQLLVDYPFKKPYSYEHTPNYKRIAVDAKIICEKNSVYLFTSNGEAGVDALIRTLKNEGTVEKVVSSYGTNLYHFVKAKKQ